MRLGPGVIWDFPCRPPSQKPLAGTCGYLPHPLAPLSPAVQDWVDRTLFQAVPNGPLAPLVQERVNEAIRAGMAFQSSRAGALFSRPGPY